MGILNYFKKFFIKNKPQKGQRWRYAPDGKTKIPVAD